MPRGRMLNKKISYDEAVNKLSIKSALLYTWCIPHLDIKGRIIGTSEYLKGNIVPFKKEIKTSDVPELLKEMENLGLVKVYGQGRYIQFNGFFKNQTLNEEREAESIVPEPTPELIQSKSRETPQEVNINLIQIKDNISKDIISYLNENTKQNYKHTTPKTQTLINTRLKEGYTITDFKAVIDIKTKEWLNTDMAKYLRPETLFGTKFESYLNQKGVTNGSSASKGFVKEYPTGKVINTDN